MPKPPKMKGWQVGLISVVISCIIMFLFWQMGYVKTDWRETEEEEEEEGEERRMLAARADAMGRSGDGYGGGGGGGSVSGWDTLDQGYRRQRGSKAQKEARRRREEMNRIEGMKQRQRARMGAADAKGHDKSSFIQT